MQDCIINTRVYVCVVQSVNFFSHSLSIERVGKNSQKKEGLKPSVFAFLSARKTIEANWTEKKKIRVDEIKFEWLNAGITYSTLR